MCAGALTRIHKDIQTEKTLISRKRTFEWLDANMIINFQEFVTGAEIGETLELQLQSGGRFRGDHYIQLAKTEGGQVRLFPLVRETSVLN